MTSARNQPLCRRYNINIGYYDGYREYPRKITQRDTSIKIHNNKFCLIFKTDGICFDKAIKDLQVNFEVVDNVISDKNVERLIKYEYKPEKFEPHLTNMIVYDLETFNSIKCVPYSNSI